MTTFEFPCGCIFAKTPNSSRLKTSSGLMMEYPSYKIYRSAKCDGITVGGIAVCRLFSSAAPRRKRNCRCRRMRDWKPCASYSIRNCKKRRCSAERYSRKCATTERTSWLDSGMLLLANSEIVFVRIYSSASLKKEGRPFLSASV